MRYDLFGKKFLVMFLAFGFVLLGCGVTAIGATEKVVGYWDITMKFGEREFNSKLHFFKGDDGVLAGTWASGRGKSKLSDVKFEEGKLSFSRKGNYGGQERVSSFAGTIAGDKISGVFKTSRGESEVTGKRAADGTINADAANRGVAQRQQRRQVETTPGGPSRTDIVKPIRNETFNKNGSCRERKQGGNPREVAGYLLFDGAMDGNRQVDPQIAVGGGYVLHGTNSGIIIYDKKGNFVQGVPQSCFNGGIDPKMFYDRHNKIFGFDLWNPWDKAKLKPVNISVSETSDPKGAWNTYPVPAPGGVDGGGIGYSKKWIGYSFPGGTDRTFVLKTAEVKAGVDATAYHFAGSLGHPVMTQDDTEDLYFFQISGPRFIIRRVTDSGDGTPKWETVASAEHGLKYVGGPPQSPQKGTKQKTASGDRNPKNLVLQGGYIWFSQTVNCNGRAAVQWHQVKMDGTIVQTGLISDPKTSYIQTTIAVNKNLDVLVGFQETNENMYISPRLAFRKAGDPKGTLREIVKLGEGKGATNGTSWGDYSGSVVDGDNYLDLWTIQSITDTGGKGDTVIVKVPFKD